jgi:hypothetical protein
MANPAPCQACLEVQDAEFYVTNRLGVPWPFQQSTVSLCVPCFIQVGISMGEALQAAMAELQAMAEPEGPGVLEQIEQDEKPARNRNKSRATAKTAAVSQSAQEEDTAATEAPDD